MTVWSSSQNSSIRVSVVSTNHSLNSKLALMKRSLLLINAARIVMQKAVNSYHSLFDDNGKVIRHIVLSLCNLNR